MPSIKRSLLPLACMPLLCMSCGDDKNEDITNAVNKNGAVETAVRISHLDSSHDILTTTHTVWTNNSMVKTVEYNDTLPALGTELTVAENEEGDKKNVQVKKDYEIYITVK